MEPYTMANKKSEIARKMLMNYKMNGGKPVYTGGMNYLTNGVNSTNEGGMSFKMNGQDSDRAGGQKYNQANPKSSYSKNYTMNGGK